MIAGEETGTGNKKLPRQRYRCLTLVQMLSQLHEIPNALEGARLFEGVR